MADCRGVGSLEESSGLLSGPGMLRDLATALESGDQATKLANLVRAGSEVLYCRVERGPYADVNVFGHQALPLRRVVLVLEFSKEGTYPGLLSKHAVCRDT